jgi:DNA adenine methylase
MRYVMYNRVMTSAAAAIQTLHARRAKDAAPFVKWVGGKRALLPELAVRFPARYNRYFEPFLGGGAVFFHLQPERALLSDYNEELIETYRTVRDDVDRLIRHLATHRVDEEYYYAMRAQDPSTLEPFERASRLIFLNRTCFNGLYRVNARGGFNVPYGKHKNPTICNEPGLRAASLALSSADLSYRSYAEVLDHAKAGDFFYFDPPYHPRNATANFTSYTAGSFTERDQAELAGTFRELSQRGCKLMLSNSDTPLIRDLYAEFHVEVVMAPRFINRDATKRGPVSELLVRNYRR